MSDLRRAIPRRRERRRLRHDDDDDDNDDDASRARRTDFSRSRTARDNPGRGRAFVRKMTEGFRRHPCLVCAMQHGSAAEWGEAMKESGKREEARERAPGETVEGTERERKREEKGESEEEREDIDRTSSRATRPPSSCQASWKERTAIRLLLLSLLFFATAALRSLPSSSAHGLSRSFSCFSSLPLSLSCPPLFYHGWVPKKRREKATRDLAVGAKNHRRCHRRGCCYYHHHHHHRRPAKTALHLRTCANCESKPPRTCSSRSDRVLLGDARIN